MLCYVLACSLKFEIIWLKIIVLLILIPKIYIIWEIFYGRLCLTVLLTICEF